MGQSLSTLSNTGTEKQLGVLFMRKFQYHRDVIHPIKFTSQAKDLSSLWYE